MVIPQSQRVSAVGRLLGQVGGATIALIMSAGCQTMPMQTGADAPMLWNTGAFNHGPQLAAFMADEEPAVAAPLGFMAFCLRNPDQCSAPSDQPQTVELDPQIWQKLQDVNEHINDSVTNEDDKAHFGRYEYWTIVTDGFGDCEDFALTKRKELIDAGLPEKALRVAIVKTWRDELHAVLTVSTNHGDYVLDSRSTEILPWNRTEYRWISRQDANDPRGWIALGRYPIKIAAAGTHGR